MAALAETYRIRSGSGVTVAASTDEYKRMANDGPESQFGPYDDDPLPTPGLPYALNLLRNDLEQLQEDVLKLRERLGPVLLEKGTGQPMSARVESAKPLCKAAIQVLEARDIVYELRQVIEFMHIGLDI